MATCPECGALHMPSARTCRVCGASLVSEAQPVEPLPTPLSSEETVPGEPPSAGAAVLKLVAIGSGTRIHLQGRAEYVLGRSDPEEDISVDVDLTDDDAWESGVSRRHARVRRAQGQVVLEDLHSANGTFLNDERLEPGQPYRLHEGDMIKLGILRLHVEQVD